MARLDGGAPTARSRAGATQVFDVAICALNTLAASIAAGGARKLFDEILREPEGQARARAMLWPRGSRFQLGGVARAQRARSYREFGFATDLLRESPPDPATPEVEPERWPTARAFARNLVYSLFLSVCTLLIMRVSGLDKPAPAADLTTQMAEQSIAPSEPDEF